MAKQIRGFWKRLCAIFATILGIGVVHEDANAGDILNTNIENVGIPAAEIKSINNCTYTIEKCVNGQKQNGGGSCTSDYYVATGDTATKMQRYLSLFDFASFECNAVRVPIGNGSGLGVAVTYKGIPVFCYDLYIAENWSTLVNKYAGEYARYNNRTLVPNTTWNPVESTLPSNGLRYTDGVRNFYAIRFGRTPVKGSNVVSDGGGYPVSHIGFYSECTESLMRLIGCTDTSKVVECESAYPRVTTTSAVPVVSADAGCACIDRGCGGNFAGDSSFFNQYSPGEEACYVNVADYQEYTGLYEDSDETGTFEYVAYDAEENKCNCFSNGNVVCS